jgi:hypothetical protein
LLEKPVTAWTTQHKAPARAMARGSPEAQGSDSLALPVVGLVDALKERRADGTALPGTLYHKHSMVDLPGLVDELGQMTEPGENSQVPRLVDDGLDAIGPPFL